MSIELKLIKITNKEHKPYYQIQINDGFVISTKLITDPSIHSDYVEGIGITDCVVSEDFAMQEFEKYVNWNKDVQQEKEVIKQITI